jgi:arsenical pump membrane protein
MLPLPVAHILLPSIVGISVLLMLMRPRGIAEVYWIGGGVALLIVLRLVSFDFAGKTIAKGSDVYFFLIGTLVTIFISKDATAVVLPPAILAAVRKARVEPLPYLFACALIANAASFVLLISNPANLVVFHDGMPPLAHWLLSYGVPYILSILSTYAIMRWIFRRQLA